MKNADKPAIPTLLYNPQSGAANGHEEGLTKREIFAMAAMQGMIADSSLDAAGAKNYELVAIDAVRYADALLTELEKQKK